MPAEPVKVKANGTKNEWFSYDPTVIMRISEDTKTLSFIPSEKKFYRFRVTEDGTEREIQIDLRRVTN
jgi:hypothetical protein